MSTKQNTTSKKEAENGKEIRIIGNRFPDKASAVKEIKNAYDKGFKSAGLTIMENSFAILFGTYTSKAIANENLKAIQKAGFVSAEIKE